MRKLVTPSEMGKIDSAMIQSGIPSLILMENAARNMLECILKRAQKPSSAAIVCGTGNNGGDGIALSRLLKMRGFKAYTVILGSPDRLTADAAANFDMAKASGVPTAFAGNTDELYAALPENPSIVVDAIFGTGLSRAPEGIYEEAIRWINNTGAMVYSADIPSGVDGATGKTSGIAVQADYTVTFQYAKLGHMLYPGRSFRGQLEVMPIGIPSACAHESIMIEALDASDVMNLLPKRRPNTNKGDYGKAAIIAGSLGMAGAAIMAAKAAIRSGAGLVTIGTPIENIPACQSAAPEATAMALPSENGRLKACLPEIRELLKKRNCAAIGPGLGHADVMDVFEYMLHEWNGRVVIDADALNIISQDTGVLKGSGAIITPHPLEMARLSGLTAADIKHDPVAAARDFTKEYGVITVLKGATSVIAAPDDRVTLNTAGSPGMAKGGSGDVLTGVITAFLAQGLEPYDAARLGCYVCGKAGEAAAKKHGEYGMSPVDTIKYIQL